MRRHLPSVFYNSLTMAGEALAALSLLLIVFLFALESLSARQHPYMGLITFMVLPVFLILGLALMAAGVVRAYRRARVGLTSEPHWPHVDLNLPGHRHALVLLMVGSFLFLVMSAFGSYQAYEYTDSVEFCGRVCHSVMKPEYTAYQASPHARVACVQCHIGSGATWFVRSKISGSYQVYAALFNKYPRPIPTPVANLRPARETCEECHWPKQFYSQKLQHKTYYLSDEHNTPWQTDLLLRIGGGNPAHGASEGIHFHMYLANNISYVAEDARHLIIPYIESHEPNGKVRIYRSTETKMTDAQIRSAKRQIVDCIECHNRPTHRFPHPAESVNQAMSLGRIDPALPEVKRLAVETLEKPYRTEAEALAGIRGSMLDFYRVNHPNEAATMAPQVDAAIRDVQRIYKLSYFPEMKTSWRAFPDHIGHMYSPGCFRCHDGKHVSDDGKVLSKDCNVCHTILSERSPDGKQRVSLAGLPFRHPVEIGDMWKQMNCSDCHAAKAEEEK